LFSDFPLNHIDSTAVIISPTQFYIWQKVAAGYGRFVLRNKLDVVVETLPT